MSSLTIAAPEDLNRLLPLVMAFHAEETITSDEAKLTRALTPLLEGSSHGVVYLVGPRRAPIGYAVVSFGWSLEFGGLDAFLDELYVRPGVRGRGIGTDILLNLPKALAGAGLRAMHLEVDRSNAKARKLYERMHFEPREEYMLMSRKL